MGKRQLRGIGVGSPAYAEDTGCGEVLYRLCIVPILLLLPITLVSLVLAGFWDLISWWLDFDTAQKIAIGINLLAGLCWWAISLNKLDPLRNTEESNQKLFIVWLGVVGVVTVVANPLIPAVLLGVYLIYRGLSLEKNENSKSGS